MCGTRSRKYQPNSKPICRPAHQPSPAHSPQPTAHNQASPAQPSPALTQPAQQQQPPSPASPSPAHSQNQKTKPCQNFRPKPWDPNPYAISINPEPETLNRGVDRGSGKVSNRELSARGRLSIIQPAAAVRVGLASYGNVGALLILFRASGPIIL